jgi:4'-phosphopantetheinyl transferase
MTSTLPHGTIDVRYVLMQDAGDEEYIKLSSQLLPEERDEASRYHRIQDRLAFAAGHVLVRKMLSLYIGESALGWRFIRNGFGKPALERAHSIHDLHFNISHTTGVAAGAVSLGREVGIDVESSADTRHNCMEIARSHFSQTEIDLLESLAGEHQPKLFFKLWTLKEAYIKARGRGLSEGLSTCSFTTDPPIVSFPTQSSEEADLWYFSQHTLMTSHVLAIAARRLQRDEQVNTRIAEIPLRELF